MAIPRHGDNDHRICALCRRYKRLWSRFRLWGIDCVICKTCIRMIVHHPDGYQAGHLVADQQRLTQ